MFICFRPLEFSLRVGEVKDDFSVTATLFDKKKDLINNYTIKSFIFL